MRARRINRRTALRALLLAAEAAGTEPGRLGQATYRRVRAEDADASLPSDLAIAMLFGGWRQACEVAHDVSRRPEDVEDAVREALYGGGPAGVERVVRL
jgi:hypothetical protein